MIANSEGTTREPRLRAIAQTAGRLGAALAVVATAGIILDATAAPVRLVEVMSQGDAVLIESSEPAPYSVSRPDPVTLIVDMRNVSVADARSNVAKQGTISGVRLEQATSVDGKAVARIHLALSRPAEHVVRSARNTIRVELTPTAAPAAKPPVVRTSAPVTSAPAAPAPVSSAPVTSAPHAAPAQVRQQAGGAQMIVVENETTPATILERIQSSKSASATTVTLSGNGRLAPTGVIESKDKPRRLVLDFPNVTSKAPTQTAIDSPLVSKVRIGLNSSQPLVTRVVMEISSSAKYRVARSGESGRDLDVVFEATKPVVDTVRIAPADPAAPKAEPEPPLTLTQAIANVASITPKEPVGSTAPQIDAMSALKTSAPAAAPSAGPTNAPASAPASGPASGPASAPANTPAPNVAARLTPQAATPAPPSSAPTPSTPAQSAQTTQARQTPPAQSKPPAPQTAPAQTTPSPTPQRSGEQRQFTGHPISLDFEGVDLRAVLRTFADVSGLNMVIDPDVNGTVDIKLTDVPWDQALDVILRGNQLDYTVDGTIVRISKIKTLEDENKMRQAAAQAAAERAAQAGGLSFETFPLSYAKAAELAPLLKGSLRLSRYGQVQTDVRTNTLIIADLPDQFPAIRDLLRTLDRAEPQVEVEARIVQTTRDFAKALGVQWGLNGRVMPDLGNTTGLAFPNRGTVGGRLGSQGPVDPRATELERAGTGVRLGVPDATSAIGLALGAVNGAFNLDVALSALERTGKGRVLSTPRLTTQNNIQAEVAQGVQIPIQTVSNNTVTVTFKDAVLVLRVTPQITAAATVIMKVEIENATADFSRQVNGIPPVDTQRALTQVQIDDGATTVIGGIFVSQEQSTNDKVPMLHRIPILGWLFKQDRLEDESRELLIFITPRILKG
ncbi:MAG TPA: type IV pilus secretin PilQ [Vicinamibacterales bacterium]|jgi:type IV pilus assembly protein PilQ